MSVAVVPPAERVVFGASMEGLYRALQPLTPQERAAFIKAGVVTDKFAVAYPLQVYVDIQNACAASRFAHLPEERRFVEIGHLFMGGYQKTLIGSAMIAVLKLIGPRRTLDRITRSMRTANNFTEGSFESVGPNSGRVRINFTVRPGFYQGVMEASLKHAGAKEVVVNCIGATDEGTLYEVSWK